MGISYNCRSCSCKRERLLWDERCHHSWWYYRLFSGKCWTRPLLSLLGNPSYWFLFPVLFYETPLVAEACVCHPWNWWRCQPESRGSSTRHQAGKQTSHYTVPQSVFISSGCLLRQQRCIFSWGPGIPLSCNTWHTLNKYHFCHYDITLQPNTQGNHQVCLGLILWNKWNCVAISIPGLHPLGRTAKNFLVWSDSFPPTPYPSPAPQYEEPVFSSSLQQPDLLKAQDRMNLLLSHLLNTLYKWAGWETQNKKKSLWASFCSDRRTHLQSCRTKPFSLSSQSNPSFLTQLKPFLLYSQSDLSPGACLPNL